MSKKPQQPISIKKKTVDFLDVPKKNVLDLRPKMPEPETTTLKRARQPSTRSAANRAIRFFLVAVAILAPLFGYGLWQRAHTLQGEVLGQSTEAYDALRSAASALQEFDSTRATEAFSEAATSFRQAQSSISGIATALSGFADVLPGASQVKSGEALLKAGEYLATAGSHVTAIISPVLASQEEGTTTQFSDVLELAQEHTDPALAALTAALNEMKKVKTQDLPESYQSSFALLAESLPQLQQGLERVSLITDTVFTLLGGQRPQRYMVLFQNTLEARPTGGFVGSLALIDVSGGNIVQLEVPTGGTYDFQGQLTEKVVAPEPLHLVNPHWQLQDANWWPDFPTSAKKMLWFYEKSGGPTVDGVLAVTPELLTNLLTITGPIDMTEKYGVTITAENMIRETLLAVDERKEDEPKQIIADLVPRVLDELFTATSLDQLAVLNTFERALIEKQLLLYFTDEQQQATIAQLGWDGAMAGAEQDYFALNVANIGGGKTDGVIDQTIEHHTVIDNDGSINVTATVTRVHHGIPDDQFTGTRNVAFVRFYVPEGSELLNTEGFERIDPKRFQAPEADYALDKDLVAIEGRPVVDELTGTRTSAEFGKTVFANWIGVGPGETTTASMTYRLPFRLDLNKPLFRNASDTYSLLIQKQPGTNGTFVVSTLTYPQSATLEWQTPAIGDSSIVGNVVTTTFPLTTDALFGAVFSR